MYEKYAQLVDKREFPATLAPVTNPTQASAIAAPGHDRPSRIVVVDALRGFALAGVVLVHMTEQYVAGPLPEALTTGGNNLPDHIVMGLIQFFIVGKFFALFSILFGLSFAIQMESAARRGTDFSLRFLWRAMLLLLIGYAHHLFYRGDILTIYAMLAPLLIPFHRVSSRWILITAGLIFVGVPRFAAFAVLGNESPFGLPGDMSGPLEEAYLAAITGGSLLEVFRLNAVYGMQAKLDFQILSSGRLYYTFGYFLLGLWLGKTGLITDPDRYAPLARKALKWSAILWPVAAVLTVATFATAPQPVDFSSWQHSIARNFLDWADLSMTTMLACAFVLLYHNNTWQNRLTFFARYGRMALSNYVLQSLIGTAMLYGWGLGLLGRFGTLLLCLIAVGLMALQALLSRHWLRHFRYGPLEWLWRCGTHLKLQPFRRRPEHAVS